MLGDYTKTTWVNGGAPGISATRLNNHEDKTAELDAAALDKTGDTATGIIVAQANTSYTVAQMHNIILSTADANVGVMGNGDIWIKYTA